MAPGSGVGDEQLLSLFRFFTRKSSPTFEELRAGGFERVVNQLGGMGSAMELFAAYVMPTVKVDRRRRARFVAMHASGLENALQDKQQQWPGELVLVAAAMRNRLPFFNFEAGFRGGRHFLYVERSALEKLVGAYVRMNSPPSSSELSVYREYAANLTATVTEAVNTVVGRVAESMVPAVHEQLRKLPQRQRESADMYFLRGMQPPAIAEELGISQRHVRNSRDRAVLKLEIPELAGPLIAALAAKAYETFGSKATLGRLLVNKKDIDAYRGHVRGFISGSTSKPGVSYFA